MSSHARSSILDALVAQISTEVTDFNLVTYDEMYWDSQGVSAGERPACIVLSGPSREDRYLSVKASNLWDVGLRIIGDSDTSQADLYDLYDAVTDAVNSDLTLNGTCIKALCSTGDRPFIFKKTGIRFLDRVLTIEYWRDT